MDPSLRDAIRIAEAERTEENKVRVWALLRRLGLRSCNCENSKCPVCRAQGCVRPEDTTTKVDYVGSLCEKCILHMPIVYHGNWDKLPGRSDVVCRCYWCQEIDKWAGYTVAKSNLLADTSLVFIAIAKPVGEWKEFYTWPLFDQYKQAIGESPPKAHRRNPDENINELERAFRYHPLDPEIQQKYVTAMVRAGRATAAQIVFPLDLQKFLAMINNHPFLEWHWNPIFHNQEPPEDPSEADIALDYDTLSQLQIPRPEPRRMPSDEEFRAELQRIMGADAFVSEELVRTLRQEWVDEEHQRLTADPHMVLDFPVIYQYDPNNPNLVNLRAEITCNSLDLGYSTFGTERTAVCAYFDYTRYPEVNIEYSFDYYLQGAVRVRLRNKLHTLLRQRFADTRKLTYLDDPDMCPNFQRHVPRWLPE